MATIRKRNGKYQVQVRINGYISSKTFPCYELAKKWANKQGITLKFTNGQYNYSDKQDINGLYVLSYHSIVLGMFYVKLSVTNIANH